MNPYEQLKNDVQVELVWTRLRELWYQHAEGFIAFSGNPQQDQPLVEAIVKFFPNGWNITLDHEGNLIAVRPLPTLHIQIELFRDRFGKETSQLTKLEE